MKITLCQGIRSLARNDMIHQVQKPQSLTLEPPYLKSEPALSQMPIGSGSKRTRHRTAL